MEWNEKQIKYILQDMIEENPMACRALFSISEIEFTDKVSTMAVTLSKQPVLKINLEFCRQHLKQENDVKAVLLHEFLHVLLLHTEKYKLNNPLLNIALDAIINAIIYRYKGMEYADFFVRFYRQEKMSFLLRPRSYLANDPIDNDWWLIHDKIYSGKYCADDLYELLDYLKNKIDIKEAENIILLGDHDKENISEEMEKVLNDIMKKMDGVMIWNKPGSRGVSEKLSIENQQILKYKKNKWEQSTLRILKKCLLPDNKTKKKTSLHEIILPVLSNTDRRAIGKFKYSGIIPFSRYDSIKTYPSQLANIYLDVSGSMNEEIEGLILLLYHFRSYIKMPLMVFSNQVAEARFKNGKLEYESTGGTSISPVFEHLQKNKIRKCLIVTDGYVENIHDEMLDGLNRDNIRVLVSANGNPEQFSKMRLPYYQLEKQ